MTALAVQSPLAGPAPATARGELGALVAGSRVNLEIDLIARYVERMLGERPGDKVQK